MARNAHLSRPGVLPPLETSEPPPAPAVVSALLRCGDPLFIIDPHYRIVAWNRAAEALFDLPADQAVGQTCFHLLNGIDLRGQRVCAVPCGPMLALQHGTPPPCFALQVEDGGGVRRPVEVSLLPLPGGFAAHVLRAADRQVSLERFAEQIRHALDRLADAALVPGDRPPAPLPGLTDREHQILRLLAQGATTRQIAASLVLSTGTVRTHIQHILAKLGAHRRLEAVAIARRLGLLP
ncbi:MAG TPA: LuxR C-terminal-related transcriptional regulator [Isosphaeraceae bacterium]|nr:LuxR C-terminal-related transcriptional regulator [Isosphaeraceae bacterium]